MNPARWAYVLMSLGAVLVVIGLMGALQTENESAVAASEQAGVTTSAESSPARATSTTQLPTTTSSPTTTTTIAPTTTSTTTSTTTTLVPDETVEDFVVRFASAIEDGDVDFLFDRLHPAVVGGFGMDLCRSWITNEILVLENYRLTGPVVGPQEQSFTTPVGQGIIENGFAAPVAFTFQGQEFESEGGFALIGSEMFWLGQCR